jgi:hypothetical protein
MSRLAKLDEWAPPETLSGRTKERLLVPIGLTTENTAAAGPRVLMVNFEELERLGIHVPGRRLTKALETELLQRFALRPAGEGEASIVTGIATRYQGYPGAVQGDGRAVLLGQARRLDDRGRPRERIDLQLKGVATGLLPRRKDWASRHGKMFLSRAIQEALYADFLQRNGVASNRWLVIIDSGTTVNRPADSKDVRVGLHVRVGQFWRMGHFWHFADDRRALAEVVNEVRTVLGEERGRGPVSLPRAYLLLLRRKVVELADAWWLRYAHGSYTPDNVGLFECMDQGTACTVDRTHPSFSAHRVGYTHGLAMLMGEDYKRYLPETFRKVATSAERAQLTRLTPGIRTTQWLESRMTYQFLRRFGLDERQVRLTLRDHRARATGWWRRFRAWADASDRGRAVDVGTNMSFRARHAAHFDVFRAMHVSLRLARTDGSVRERAQRLLHVLRPELDRIGSDLTEAAAFVELVDELISIVLGDGPRRLAELTLWHERARALTRRIRPLEGADSLELAERFVEARERAVRPGRLRAFLGVTLRRNLIDGPGAPIWAARQLRLGKAPRLPDGRWIVSTLIENGVEFQQVSDGVHDAFRFVVARSLQRDSEPGLRLELKWGSSVWLSRAAQAVTPEAWIFEVPIDRALPRHLRARFTGLRRHSNAGVGYGRGVPIVFRSLDVQVELARKAQQRGQRRQLPAGLAVLVA